MKLLNLILLSLLLSCSASKHVVNSSLGKYNFAYTIKDANRTNLIQAFDDGKSTYLHFFELDFKNLPSIYSRSYQSDKLPFRQDENYLIIPKLHDTLLIYVDKHSTLVFRDVLNLELK